MTEKSCGHGPDEQKEEFDSQKNGGDACDMVPDRLDTSQNHASTRRDERVGDEDSEDGYDDIDYTPGFIHDALRDPPLFPGESRRVFEDLFESFEMNYAYPHRPKRDAEFFLVLQATTAACELLRYDRMKACVVAHQRRSAVQALHLQSSLTEAASNNERHEARRSAREASIRFFTDPSYRAIFAERLDRCGLGLNAVEEAAFLKGLPSLLEIDRLIRSAEKRLANCLKRLDASYASRGPEDPMPRSFTAIMNERTSHAKGEIGEGSRVRQGDPVEARPEDENGNGKADSGE